jgi:hypothetical protein
MLLVISGAHNNRLAYLAAEGPTNWLATVASNQSYASYIGVGFHSEQNAPAKEPIEWTLAARPSRTPGVLPSPITNSLIR